MTNDGVHGQCIDLHQHNASSDFADLYVGVECRCQICISKLLSLISGIDRGEITSMQRSFQKSISNYFKTLEHCPLFVRI